VPDLRRFVTWHAGRSAGALTSRALKRPEAAWTESGFTLLELLVALGLLALVLGGTYTTLVQTRTAVEQTHASAEAAEIGHQAVALIGPLLESTYYRPDRPDLVLRGISTGRGPESADSLRFVTTAGALLSPASRPGDPVACRLMLRTEPDRRRLLVLEIAAPAGGDPHKPPAGFVLSTEIEGLDLAYLTPQGWAEDYDPSAWSGLPLAIRIRTYSNGQLGCSRIVWVPLAEAHPARSAEP
jgi:prepilin-type N-terminal cleavage/methylation domain-containing protein